MARSTKHAFSFVWITVLLDMVGLGLIIPIVPAILRELTGTPPDERGKAFGMLGAAFGVGFVVGPILMTQVFGAFEHSVPGAPFFVAALLSTVALVVAMRAAPPPKGTDEPA